MPDYCDNDLTVSHPDPRMMFRLIRASAPRYVQGLGWDGPGLFMTLDPIPHEVRYAWRVDGPEAELRGLDLSGLGFETAIRRYPALEEGGDRVEHLVASHRSRWAGLSLRRALRNGPLRVTAGPRRALSWDAETAAERWGTGSDAFVGAKETFEFLDDEEKTSRLDGFAKIVFYRNKDTFKGRDQDPRDPVHGLLRGPRDPSPSPARAPPSTTTAATPAGPSRPAQARTRASPAAPPARTDPAGPAPGPSAAGMTRPSPP